MNENHSFRFANLMDAKQDVFWGVLGFLLLATVYVLLFGNYRLEAIDDAWSLSFDWHFSRNILSDPVFRFNETPVLFQKTRALLYAPLLDVTGWTRGNAHLLALVLTLGGVFVWCGILKHLAWRTKDIAIFAFLALLLEPFLGAANLTRPESLCFFFFSSSLLLFIKKCYFTAVLVACLAVETHAMGVISFFYFLSWALISFSKEDWKQAVPQGIAAALLGIAYFFWVNGATFDSLLETIRTGREFSPSFLGTFSQYFIYRAHYRHVPELLILLFLGALFVKNKLFQKHRFLSLALVLAFIGSLIIRRGGYIYVIYYFPVFIMLMIVTAAHYKKQILLAILFVGLLLPQYSYLWWKQRGFDFETYVAAVQEAVPNDGIPIVGSSNNWFAFMETGRFHDYYAAPRVAEHFPSLYAIEGYFPPYSSDKSAERGLAVFSEVYERRTEIASFEHFGKTIRVCRWERKK